MKNKIVLVLLGLLLIPNVTFAAWWNPFSWKILSRSQKPVPSVEIPKEEKEPMVNKEVVAPKAVPNNPADKSTEIEKLESEIRILKEKVDQSTQVQPTKTVTPIVEVKATTPAVEPPTTQQLEAFMRMCGEVPEACKDSRAFTAYMSNLNFRALIDDQVEKYNKAKGIQTHEAVLAKKKQLECLSEPTPLELRTLSPEQQRRIRESKCGVTTPVNDLEYKLYQQQKYQECVNKNPSNYSWYCEKPIFY